MGLNLHRAFKMGYSALTFSVLKNNYMYALFLVLGEKLSSHSLSGENVALFCSPATLREPLPLHDPPPSSVSRRRRPRHSFSQGQDAATDVFARTTVVLGSVVIIDR
jgi:hypothetical protein